MAAAAEHAPVQLVLLHGLGANRSAFQRFSRLLPDAWDVQPLDLLGHGDAPKPAAGYGLADYAAHLAQQLRDLPRTGSDLRIVAGHSLGAAVAVQFAATYPDDASPLILLDPPDGTDGTTHEMLNAKLEGRIGETVHRLFAHMGEPLRNWTIGTWHDMAPGVARELDSDWHAAAVGVSVPVTVIHGERAHGATGEGAADWFADADEVLIDGAGHYLHATHARDTAGALVATVDRLIGAAR